MSALNKGDEDDPGNTPAFLNLADFNTLLSDRDSEMGEPAAGTINIQDLAQKQSEPYFESELETTDVFNDEDSNDYYICDSTSVPADLLFYKSSKAPTIENGFYSDVSMFNEGVNLGSGYLGFTSQYIIWTLNKLVYFYFPFLEIQSYRSNDSPLSPTLNCNSDSASDSSSDSSSDSDSDVDMEKSSSQMRRPMATTPNLEKIKRTFMNNISSNFYKNKPINKVSDLSPMTFDISLYSHKYIQSKGQTPFTPSCSSLCDELVIKLKFVLNTETVEKEKHKDRSQDYANIRSYIKAHRDSIKNSNSKDVLKFAVLQYCKLLKPDAIPILSSQENTSSPQQQLCSIIHPSESKDSSSSSPFLSSVEPDSESSDSTLFLPSPNTYLHSLRVVTEDGYGTDSDHKYKYFSSLPRCPAAIFLTRFISHNFDYTVDVDQYIELSEQYMNQLNERFYQMNMLFTYKDQFRRILMIQEEMRKQFALELMVYFKTNKDNTKNIFFDVNTNLEITPQEYEQRFIEFFNRCNAEGHYLHYCAIEKSLWREQAVREGEMEENDEIYASRYSLNERRNRSIKDLCTWYRNQQNEKKEALYNEIQRLSQLFHDEMNELTNEFSKKLEKYNLKPDDLEEFLSS